MDGDFGCGQLHLVLFITVYAPLASSLEIVVVTEYQWLNSLEFSLIGRLRGGSRRMLGRGVNSIFIFVIVRIFRQFLGLCELHGDILMIRSATGRSITNRGTAITRTNNI